MPHRPLTGPLATLPPTVQTRVLAARSAWLGRPMPAGVRPEPPGPGRESVWDYPRPPRIEPAALPVRVVLGGRTIAETRAALRVLETASPPTLYIPPGDFDADALGPAQPGGGICEWKGVFAWHDLTAGGRVARRAAWSFPDPFTDLAEGYAAIAGHVAVYPGRVDACFLGGERVRPQDGGYYGGWVTDAIAGPMKGGPGTEGW